MDRTRTTRKTIACALLWASTLTVSALPVTAQTSSKAREAFYEGKRVRFDIASAKRGRMLRVGETSLGPVARSKPSDRRPILYIVVPGGDREGFASAAFNLIVNDLPRDDKPVIWDVYWALVLDPSVATDFTDERELLIATQGGFSPADSFRFDQMAAASVLRGQLNIESVEGLDRFRLPDGSLPRVLIAPAEFAIRARAVDPDTPAPPKAAAGARRLSQRVQRGMKAPSNRTHHPTATSK